MIPMIPMILGKRASRSQLLKHPSIIAAAQMSHQTSVITGPATNSRTLREQLAACTKELFKLRTNDVESNELAVNSIIEKYKERFAPLLER